MLLGLEATWWNFGPHIVYISMFCGFNWMGLLNIHKVLKVAHRRFIFWSLKRVKAYLYFRMYFCYEIFIVFSFSYLCLVRVLFLDQKITASGIWFLHFSYSIFYIIFCQHLLNNDYSWHLHSVIVIGFGAVWYKCGLCLGLLPIKFHIKNYHSVSCSTSGGCNIHLLLQSTF